MACLRLSARVLFDAAGWFRGVPSWWTTGGHLSLAGIGTALLAAILGVIDCLYTVPPDSSGKARATKHMLANLTAVTLCATIVYDETRDAPDDIKTVIADCGYHYRGEVLNMKTVKEAR